ncbi:uncharacterized protein LOC130672696 [Microplitis mediator]|uniref:uncharacterized protein LOC130672696 n=1 Tax=Microplitis mediator TaxID=375433 RepID=UPI0025579F26|nr:uncharacterized protein LOC130672696 [Microplitis mediator]
MSPNQYLGGDFLSHFDLLVDLKRKCLRDGITGLTSSGYFHVTTSLDKIKAVDGDSVYMKLLREFADITRPHLSDNKKRKHSTVHYIRTTPGPPVSSKARHSSPDKLKIAQEEFRKIIKQGICQLSQSAWSSPLHMVQEKHGGWRPCGDYRPLNDRALIDKYALRYMDDFAKYLHGKHVFFVVDFTKAFL